MQSDFSFTLEIRSEHQIQQTCLAPQSSFAYIKMSAMTKSWDYTIFDLECQSMPNVCFISNDYLQRKRLSASLLMKSSTNTSHEPYCKEASTPGKL